MKKIILSVVIVLLGMATGCRLSCTPYDCCGPIYSNPHNCDPNYRSGSAFNADCQCAATTENVAPASAPAEQPTTQVPANSVPATSSSAPAETTTAPAQVPATVPAEVPAAVPATPVATPVAPAPTATPAPLPSGEIPAATPYVPQ